MNGEFNEELFYRLSALTLVLPPLGERKRACQIAEFCLKQQAARLGVGLPNYQVSVELLQGYSWPGNVRQLKTH